MTLPTADSFTRCHTSLSLPSCHTAILPYKHPPCHTPRLLTTSALSPCLLLSTPPFLFLPLLSPRCCWCAATMTSFTKLTSAHAAAPRTLTAAPLWRRSPAAELPRPPSPSTFIPSSSAPPSFSSHLLLHLPYLTTTSGGPPPTYPKTNFYPLSSNWLFPLLLPEVP